MSELDKILENCNGCKLCVDECDFLQRYCSSPKELAEVFKAGKHKSNPEIPYSCNICSLCEVRCPKGLNIGKMCFEARHQLVQEGLAPLEQHQPLARALDWNESDAFKAALPATSASETKRVFFPGCALSSYSPDLVLKTFDYLQQKLPGTGILLGCCGAPALLDRGAVAVSGSNQWDRIGSNRAGLFRDNYCMPVLPLCSDAESTQPQNYFSLSDFSKNRASRIGEKRKAYFLNS